jgi:hypothetical protein
MKRAPRKRKPARKPARKPDLAWFGDRFEIGHVIEVLRDVGAALRTPDLAARQAEQLNGEGLPWLRALLESALAPWRRARRAPNTFEAPLLEALSILDVRHAGELAEPSLRKLEAKLVEAHTARLDADAVSAALQRRDAWIANNKKREEKAVELAGKIETAATDLIKEGTKPRKLASALAEKFDLSTQQIRAVLKEKEVVKKRN